jgi:tetratricopeptide (TPR) repeat protein
VVADPIHRVRVLIRLARACAAGGDLARAAELVSDAQQAVHRVDEFHQSEALAEIIPAVVALGDPERAEEIARSDTFRPAALRMLGALVHPLAASGDHRRAEQLARMISDQNCQADALATVAQAVAAAGDLDRAADLSRDAEVVVYRGTDAFADSWLMTAEAAAVDPDRAERLAGTVTDPHQQARAWSAIARAVQPDDPDRAAVLNARAEQVARTIEDEPNRAWALDEVARTLNPSPGRPGRGYPEYSSWGMRTLGQIARSAAAVGDLDRATAILDRIDPTEIGSEELLGQAEADRYLTSAHAAIGNVDRALELLDENDDDSPAKWQAIGEVARSVAVAGSFDRAVQITATAGYRYLQEGALVEVVRAVSAAGDPERAEEIALTIDDVDLRTRALVELITATGLPAWMV